MALVICRVLFTLRILRRKSSTFAIVLPVNSDQWSVISYLRFKAIGLI
jgi:hypothetical protein